MLSLPPETEFYEDRRLAEVWLRQTRLYEWFVGVGTGASEARQLQDHERFTAMLHDFLARLEGEDDS